MTRQELLRAAGASGAEQEGKNDSNAAQKHETQSGLDGSNGHLDPSLSHLHSPVCLLDQASSSIAQMTQRCGDSQEYQIGR